MAALAQVNEAIAKAGYTGQIEIGMDVAASEFYRDGKYDLDFKNPKLDPTTFITPDQLSINCTRNLSRRIPWFSSPHHHLTIESSQGLAEI